MFAGPTGDPAGVDPGAANNIAQAFADVAAAGVGGTAKYFSRGGSNNAPGRQSQSTNTGRSSIAPG